MINLSNDISRLYWIDAPDGFDTKDPQYHICTIYRDSEGVNNLMWATNPEPIVQLGMKNLDVEVIIDSENNRWAGYYLIHFINSCPIKHYQHIGQRF